MEPKQIMEKQAAAATPTPVFVEAEKLADQMKELFQAVARRAYEFFDGRGREVGRELDDWFRAESELTRFIPMEVKMTDHQVVIRAEVPGFRPEEIKVNVEPRQLIISGQSEYKKEEEKEDNLFSEFQARQFCRTLRLPAEIDPQKATATLANGVLELTLAKSTASKATEVIVESA